MGDSRAGQANEAGSVHRRGVAAYLAAYGLVSRGLPGTGHAAGGPFPIRLEFETDQPTDDVNCVLSDGSRLYVSAKRTCGNDQHVRNTVKQWVAQVPTLNDHDQLVLATAQPKGIVKDLGAALLRRRASSSTYLANETKALKVFEGLLSSVHQPVRERVLDAACVLTIDAAEAGCSDFDLAATLLEGTVVPAGAGVRSIEALSQAMHTQAGKAYASDVDNWVQVLGAAGIEVYADGEGPAGAVARARQAALEVYRAKLSHQDGVVDLSLLAEDLPSLVVESLADDLRVSAPGGDERPAEEALLVLARRWTRMLVVGLPGSGKSTALRQLAARWACDRRAPVPIYVPLRIVARRCEHSSAVTVSVLCEVAALDAESGQRADLAAALERRCREGRAVLLLDGLDECRHRQALAADGLRMLLESLPTKTGVILATRSSGVPAAKRLGLPAVQLTTPHGLDDVLRRLLQHVAEVRVAEPQRAAWVATRVGWLKDTREAHRDLGSVPLLATLLALVAADSTNEQLPNDRATLLMTAVRNSVHRWERHRLGSSEEHAEWPNDAQLLDGYAALGHLLAVSGEISTQDASAGVSALLAEPWGLAPRPAEELANWILRFWDEHVGVFVGTDTGTVVPRSRVFTEIATAMWVRRFPDEPLAAWVSDCLPESDRRIALLLAAQLEPRVMRLLLTNDDAATAKTRTLLAAEAVRNGAALNPQQLECLMDHLAAVARDSLDSCMGNTSPETVADEPKYPDAKQHAPKAASGRGAHDSAPWRRTRRGGPGWDCAQELARLRLPRELRYRRRSMLERVALSDEQQTLAYALSDAAVDRRVLNDAEATAVRSLLNLPLPERARLHHDARRRVVQRSGPSLLVGHAEAAVAAAHHLDVLGDSVAQRIHDIAARSNMHIYFEVVQALAASGHHFEMPGWRKAFGGLAELAAVWYLEEERPLLRAAAELADDDIETSEARNWRLPDLCGLFTVLELDDVAISSFVAATTIDTDEMRSGWLRAAAVAAGLDIAAIAAQARLALDERGNDDKQAIMHLLTAPGSGPRPTTNASRLGIDEQEALITALGATSDWIAHSASELLRGSRGEQLRDQLLRAMPRLPAHRRYLTALLACEAADDPTQAAAQLLEQTDPAARAGAIRCLSVLPEPNEQAHTLLAQARVADDFTIRLAAGRVNSRPPSTHP